MPYRASQGNHVSVHCVSLNFLVAAVPHQEISEPVSTRAPAFRALDAQYVELANEITEDDRAVAGTAVLLYPQPPDPGRKHRTLRLIGLSHTTA